jgi:hypothetical protein
MFAQMSSVIFAKLGFGVYRFVGRNL